MNWIRTLALVVVLSVPVLAGDWPQWLGPHRDGSTPEKIKPWKDALKVVWRKELTIERGRVRLDGRLHGRIKVQPIS